MQDTMATPIFEILALTSFVNRLHGTKECEVTLNALLKGVTLGRKNLAKQLGKALLPVTLLVHPDKIPVYDKDVGKALFSSMRNPATGAIFKEIRAVRSAEEWYRNAWVTAVIDCLGIPHESVLGLADMGIKLNTPEQQADAIRQIRHDRAEDADIANAAAALQSKLKAKFVKKQATGNMCADSQAIVIYTDTFLSKSIDKLRVGGATQAERAAIHKDMFKAASHITSELHTPTRTQPVTEDDDDDCATTDSDDELAPMDVSPVSAPAELRSDAPLKRARDKSDSDISVASSPTKRARKKSGRGTPIGDFGYLADYLKLAYYWTSVLKPDNPARKCTANAKTSMGYFNTLSKILQRNFPTKESLTKDAIEELTKETILQDIACFPFSNPTEKNPVPNQKASMARLCAWGRFTAYTETLDEDEFHTLLTTLPATTHKTKDVRSLGMHGPEPMDQ